MTMIRGQRPDDLDAVHSVVTDAFADTGRVAALVDALLAGPARVSLVATDGEQLVGHVALSRGWLDADRELVEVLVLSPLSVITARQRQGIGGQLVRAALDAAGDLGAPLVFLEGNPTYYLQHGFRRAGELGFGAPSARIPEVAFQVVTLDAWQPWMTGALVYPDAFWERDCVGRRRDRTPG